MNTHESTTSRVVRIIVIYVFLIWCLIPVVWLVSTSLKSDVDAFSETPVWFFTPQWSNYLNAWNDGFMGRAMASSALVAVTSSLIGIACGLPLAYWATQVLPVGANSARRVTLFVLLLTTVPPVLGLTPLFRVFNNLGISRGPWGITLVHSYYAVLLAFLILRSFLESFPRDVREAALVDGAGEWRTLFQCIAPNLVGSMFATFILALIQSWNEYLYALVLTGGDFQTVPVRVASFFTFVGTNWSTLTAAGVIGTLPIIVFAILARDYMARGLSYGGIK